MVCSAVSMLNVFVFNDLADVASPRILSACQVCWRARTLTFCVHMLWCQHTITPYGVDVIRLTLFPERHDFWIQFSCHFICYFDFSAQIGVLLAIFPIFLYFSLISCFGMACALYIYKTGNMLRAIEFPWSWQIHYMIRCRGTDNISDAIFTLIIKLN